MSRPDLSAGPFQLGDFTIEPARHLVTGPDGATLLEPKVMAVLVMLARSPGEVVARQELIESVWASEFSGDESLTRAISLLRKAFGDARDARRYIETIPKHGYRLAEVPVPRSVDPSQRPAGADGAATDTPRPPAGKWVAAVLAIGALLALTVLFVRPSVTEPPAAEGQFDPAPVVAVLPWRNRGDDDERVEDYVADGLADELLSSLTKSPDVSVIASSTTFRYRDFDGDFERLARELEVTHAVTGVVRRTPSGVSVSAELVEAPGGVVIWSDVVEAPAAEIFDIPFELSREILAGLGATKPSRDVALESSPDPLAYDAYLRATTLLRGGPPENLVRAIDYLEAAIERDPRFADALAQHALALLNLLLVRPENPLNGQDPPTRLIAIRESARRALALDPGHVLARLALATADYRERVAGSLETDRRYREILGAAPNHPAVTLRMAIMQHELGFIGDAVDLTARARSLDPLSLLPNGVHLEYLYTAGRTEGLRDAWEDLVARWSVEPFVYFRLLIFEWQDFPAARGWVERAAARHDPRYAQLLYRLIDGQEQGTSPEDREALVLEMRTGMAQGWLNVYDGAQLLGAVATAEEMFSFAAERIAAGDDFILSVLYKPTLQRMRRDRRVMQLFQRDGVLEYWLQSGRWPDFCAEPALPYNCRAEADRLADGTDLAVTGSSVPGG